MTIKKFISFAFDKIHESFPNALIEYQNKGYYDTHYIKVSPPNVYKNIEFATIGWEIKDKYEEMFDDGSICFLTDQSLIQIDNPTLVLDPSQIVLSKVVMDANKKVTLSFSDLDGHSLDTEVIKFYLPEFNSNLEGGNYQLAMAA